MKEVIVEKLWGQERILHNDSKYCMKELTINPGFKSSMHRHIVKEETFLVVAGIALVEFDKMLVELPPGTHITMSSHRGIYHAPR
jgi:mannose-6-phosphate isomerase-like protein (cupin superfamily)